MLEYLRLSAATICMLLNMLQYSILPNFMSVIITAWLMKVTAAVVNTKITVHGNTTALTRNRMLVMSNHYDGLDYIVLASILPFPLYTIVKADLVGNPHDENFLSSIMSHMKGTMMKSLHFIPYRRGDREDGSLVQNTITNTLNLGHNVLVFPEGDTSKNGVPKDFKSGIFHLAMANRAKILPITLKYSKDIGWIKGEPLNLIKWLDNEVDIYVHSIINSEYEFSAMDLKERIFDAICSPQ